MPQQSLQEKAPIQLLPLEPETHDPILLFTMGKVGTKTIEYSLREYGAPHCIHIAHNLNPLMLQRWRKRINERYEDPYIPLEAWHHAWRIRRTVTETLGKKRWQVISLVRDPVARSLSTYFENLSYFFANALERFDAGDLTIDNFIEGFFRLPPSKFPQGWFDTQMKFVFGIDVYEQPFPKEKGYALYRGKHADLLVLRLEDVHRCAPHAMKQFLGLDTFSIASDNRAQEKPYAALYKESKEHIRFPVQILNRIYNGTILRHFYSAEEIQTFRSQYHIQ